MNEDPSQLENFYLPDSNTPVTEDQARSFSERPGVIELLWLKGLIETVTTIPTHTPTKFFDQFKIYVDSVTSPTVNRLYYYSNQTHEWYFGGSTSASSASLSPSSSASSSRSASTSPSSSASPSSAASGTEKFGGTGNDSTLSVSSGTTTVDLGGAAVVVKNYSSIAITGTGKVAFSSPHPNGTIVIFRSQGNVTLTSSTNPNIDLVGMGATTGATPNAFLGTAAVYGSVGANGTTQHPTGIGGAGGAIWDHLNHYITYVGYLSLYNRTLFLAPGAAGSAGGAGEGGASAGTGSRGGGAILIECAGALNYTATGAVSVSGAAGSNGTGVTNPSDNKAGGGGGGGGSTGMCIILYNSLTANSGTILAAGGVGGTGGGPSDGFSGSAFGGGGGGGGASLEGAGATGSSESDTTAAPVTPTTPSPGAGGGGGAGGSGSIAFGSNSAGNGGAGGATSTKHYIVAQNDWFA